MLTEEQWSVGTIAAVIGAIGVFGFGFYEFVIAPFWGRRSLRHPCRAWFLIPSTTTQEHCVFAEQDHREHYVEEVTLPAHSESDIEIEVLYQPSVSFAYSAMYFGCNEQNNLDLDTKPLIRTRTHKDAAIA